jgi:peptide-methionine (S)-S-oxide reductase
VVEVAFDPARLPLDQLLDAFWAMHDPTACSKGQYRSVIYTTTPEQQAIAEASKVRLDTSRRHRRAVCTTIEPAGTFWRAEEYHQRFYEKKGFHRAR